MTRVRLSSVEYNSLGETLQDVINKKLAFQYQEEQHELQKQIEWQLNNMKKFEDQKYMKMFIDDVILVYIEKYIILYIRGKISYIEDFNGCIQKRDEIVEVFSEMFPNEQLQDASRNIRGDPSGDSIMVGFFFDLDSGDRIQAECTDFEENFRIKNNMTEGLNISINSAEIVDWFLN